MALPNGMRRYLAGNIRFDPEARVFRCTVCGEWYYDDPFLLRFVDLTPRQQEEAELGGWGLAVCPTLRKVAVWGALPPPHLALE